MPFGSLSSLADVHSRLRRKRLTVAAEKSDSLRNSKKVKEQEAADLADHSDISEVKKSKKPKKKVKQNTLKETKLVRDQNGIHPAIILKDGELRFKCPLDGCESYFKNPNGLSYHITNFKHDLISFMNTVYPPALNTDNLDSLQVERVVYLCSSLPDCEFVIKSMDVCFPKSKIRAHFKFIFCTLKCKNNNLKFLFF
jgi:hypothetical protein